MTLLNALTNNIIKVTGRNINVTGPIITAYGTRKLGWKEQIKS